MKKKKLYYPNRTVDPFSHGELVSHPDYDRIVTTFKMGVAPTRKSEFELSSQLLSYAKRCYRLEEENARLREALEGGGNG